MKTPINSTFMSFAIVVLAIFVFPFNSLKSENGKFIRFTGAWQQILSMADRGDYLLIGTSSEGIMKFNKQTGKTVKVAGSDSVIKNLNVDMQVDKNNKVWGLSNSSSLIEYNGEGFNIYNISDIDYGSFAFSCLMIDDHDNKWVGTGNKGLFKFDGTQWKNYNKANSKLLSDNILCLDKDVNGNIWIGTDVGLFKFDGTDFTLYQKVNTGLISNIIKSIAIDSKNQVWIGTDRGMVKYDGTEWTTFKDSNITVLVNDIIELYIDNNDNLYVGTRVGFAIYDHTNWIEYNRSNSGLTDNFVSEIITDASGNMWLSAYLDGLIKFDGTNWSNYQFLKQNYQFYRDSHVVEDKNGIIWVQGTKAIQSFDGYNWRRYGYTNSDLPVNVLDYYDQLLTCIAVDSNNNIWVGSLKFGVIKFDGSTWTTYNTSNSGLQDNGIRSLHVTKDNKLIVNAGITTTIYDGVSWQSTNRLATSMAFDKAGVIWNVSTKPNVLWYWENIDGKAVQVHFYPPVYQDTNLAFIGLVIDSEDNKWISSTSGLLKYDGTNWTRYDFTNLGYNFPYKGVAAITIDKNDELWMFVSYGYLVRFDGGENWKVDETFIPAMGAPNYITSITVDMNGNLWAGTSWNGVYVFNEDEIILNPADVIETFIQNDYKIFPNPVEDFININGLESNNFEYHIFDLSMKQVAHSFGVSNQLDVSSLNTGIYYLVIKEKSKLQAMKFIKK
ncbi:MAG: hypothetical protein CVV22_02170 [Ignavibacteriae bacterium HGW-Ignavibacteriae-1]|jgi:ligand-binding sensor domain-containing protein|nr:MAG: hypothetical protein CVV22_02170 [Ignavibacteriae bacterium HGW-Ignavibacteriae-1]